MKFDLMEFLNSLDKQKIMLIVLVSVGLIYVDFAYIMQAQLKGLKSRGPKIVKLKKDIETLNKDIASAKAQQQSQSAVTKESSREKKLIPLDQVPSLLENIAKLARKHGISIMQISSAKEKEAAKAPAKPGAPVPSEPYQTMAISLEAECDYHALGAFVGELNQLQAVITVSEMIITPGSEEGIKQNVSLQLKTYVKK